MPKMICDICGKAFPTLGRYGDDKWWVCLKCFDKADAMASACDRWPDARDFEKLKQKSRAGT